MENDLGFGNAQERGQEPAKSSDLDKLRDLDQTPDAAGSPTQPGRGPEDAVPARGVDLAEFDTLERPNDALEQSSYALGQSNDVSEQPNDTLGQPNDALEKPNEAVKKFFGPAFSAIEHFAAMLEEEGELRGLIGPRELPRLWSRHLVNSAAIVDFIGARKQVMDIGSGAGFPGIVLDTMRPDLDVHLTEPMERRVEWLEDVVYELGLDNVTIHRARAEELHGVGVADVVTARAVAALRKLVPMTLPLVASGGSLVALKGRQVDAEINNSQKVLQKFHVKHVEVHEVPSIMEDESTRVLVATKAKRDFANRGRAKRGGHNNRRSNKQRRGR